MQSYALTLTDKTQENSADDDDDDDEIEKTKWICTTIRSRSN